MPWPDNVQLMGKRAGKSEKGGKPTLPRDEADRVLSYLKRLRERFSSDTAMGDALGVSQPTASGWLAGDSSPGLPHLDVIASHFELTEYEMRKGVPILRLDDRSPLEIALRYHGVGKWPDSVIATARERARKGESRSSNDWATLLDQLAAPSRRG